MSAIHEDKPHRGKGRPSIFTQELADKICSAVAISPMGLTALCKSNDWMPDKDTVNDWRFKNKDFSAQYTIAKRMQAEIMVETLEDVSDYAEADAFVDDKGARRVDSGIMSLAKLRADNRKWAASKLAPKLYGDQKQIDDLKDENALLRTELLQMRAELAAKHKKEF